LATHGAFNNISAVGNPVLTASDLRAWLCAHIEIFHSSAVDVPDLVAMKMRDVMEISVILDRAHEGLNIDACFPADARTATLGADFLSRHDQLFPILDSSDLNRFRRFGYVRACETGESLFGAGTPGIGLLALLARSVLVSRKDGLSAEIPIVEYIAGQFMGKIGQLSAGLHLYGPAINLVEAFVTELTALRTAALPELNPRQPYNCEKVVYAKSQIPNSTGAS
jgi:hypothetical protein